MQFLAQSFYVILIHMSFAKASGTFSGFPGLSVEKAF
jgi:hypothetical protein